MSLVRPVRFNDANLGVRSTFNVTKLVADVRFSEANEGLSPTYRDVSFESPVTSRAVNLALPTESAVSCERLVTSREAMREFPTLRSVNLVAPETSRAVNDVL